jgi:hypothetical protein
MKPNEFGRLIVGCLALAACMAANAYARQQADPRAVVGPDIKITFARRSGTLFPRVSEEVQYPADADLTDHGTFSDIVDQRISALEVTWSDPRRFKAEEQTADFLRRLLSSTNTRSWTYHVWSRTYFTPLVTATVEHVSGNQGKLLVYPSKKTDSVYWAYQDGNGKWWWGDWDVSQEAAPKAAGAETQSDPAAVVQSQENQSAGLAATWLGSGDARTRAWGAYVALRDRREELLPQLLALMGAHRVASGPPGPGDYNKHTPEYENHTAMLGVLDAVIQMDANVPPKEAARLYPEFPVQALILLDRWGPTASSSLLDIFRKENAHTLAWIAAGDILVKQRPTGFAAIVLGGLTVNAQVSVVDKDSKPYGGGVGGSCPSTPPGPWPSGWPPIASYSLGGAIKLAGGIDPSFFTRAEGETAPYTEDPCDFLKPSRDVVREGFLTDFVGGDPFGNLPFRLVETTVTWRSDAQYLMDLHAFVDREQQLFEKLSGRLVALGLVSADEARVARPVLQLQISDRRRGKEPALPALRNLGDSVRISTSSSN